jgi:HD-like signal output (HDOD) protein
VSDDKNNDIAHEDLQKVMATVDIPTCPAAVAEAMQEAQRDEPDLQRLADIVTSDPGMSAAAIKLANSPIYGASSKISGVRQAVGRLGTKNLVCVIIATALRASASGLPAAWVENFWRHITLVAVASSLIARRQYGISPDAAYTYALFHDAAIPLMMRRFPDYAGLHAACLAESRMLIEAEAGFFPCTHPVVGSLLVRNWGLPPLLGQAIRFHHEEDAYDLPERSLPGTALSLIAVTQVAEHLLCEVLEQNDVEIGHYLFGRALNHLGISEGDLDELRGLIARAVEDARQA